MKKTAPPLPPLVCPAGLKSLPANLCKGFRIALYEPCRPPHLVAVWVSQPFANNVGGRRRLERCWSRFCESFDVSDTGDFSWGLFPYHPECCGEYGGYGIDDYDDTGISPEAVVWLEDVKDEWADVTGGVTA